ncbi:MAG: T9SS type A sorting domain-containing protein [Saprospiraceae bacterium]|nr:T9SS type A sorting domain-containing protein [Saprospiraceae bacterium]
MKWILSLIFVGHALSLFSQFKHDYVWLMGMQYSVDAYPLHCMNVFDFNEGSLQIISDSIDSQFSYGNASCSDKQGKLLFYSNGCYIKNRNHEIMPNGNHLNPSVIYDLYCPDNGYIISGGLMALPTIDTNIYFLLHQANELFETSPSSRIKLYYSIVDMSLNGGFGEVTLKNQILLSSLLQGSVQAVRHENNSDWWILTLSKTGKKYYRVLLSNSGIVTIDSQSIGADLTVYTYPQMSFSPDGSKFAHFDHINHLQLYDFNRSNGKLNNYQHMVLDEPMPYLNALSFSPSGRFLYISSRFKLYQLDLEASDILGSKVLVGEYDEFKFEIGGIGYSVNFGRMQLGPDCKIYMTPHGFLPYMHVINKPDEFGTACNFVQRGIELPCSANYSIPNFPNYRLGTGQPVCDSNIVYVSSGYVPPPEKEAVRVWPNPASSEVRVELSATVSTKTSTLRLFDGTGRLVGQWELSAGSSGTAFSVADRPVGMYFWSVEREGRGVGSGKLIISR